MKGLGHTIGQKHGLQTTGGWCIDLSPRAHDAYSQVRSHRPNGSYFLPRPHLAADAKVVAFLSRLLRRCDDDACAEPRFLSLNDFGAGVGMYGHALLAVDPRHRWFGYDGAGNIETASNGFVRYFDITIPLALPRTDWVMSLEVGEHVPPAHEMMMIRNLHAHNCRGIVLSWAYPMKTGVGHVNNHSPEYLAGIFARLGYRVNEGATRELRNNRTAYAFAVAFRGSAPPESLPKTVAGPMMARWRRKGLSLRNVSQAWWWIRPTVFERVVPLTGCA